MYLTIEEKRVLININIQKVNFTTILEQGVHMYNTRFICDLCPAQCYERLLYGKLEE